MAHGRGGCRTGSRTSAAITTRSRTCLFYAPFRALARSSVVPRRHQLPQQRREGLGAGQHRVFRVQRGADEIRHRSQRAVGSAARDGCRSPRACTSSSTPAIFFASFRTATSSPAANGGTFWPIRSCTTTTTSCLNVTAGPAVQLGPGRDIWELNFGRYRRIHELVTAQRPVAVSVAADNERFSTDVGVRNTRGERHSDCLRGHARVTCRWVRTSL